MLFLDNLVEIGVRTIGIEGLVAVHDCYEVFVVAQIDDVVCVTRKHLNGLYFVATDFIVPNLICSFTSHLYQSVSADDNECFPF